MDIIDLASNYSNRALGMQGALETVAGICFVVLVAFLEWQRRTTRDDVQRVDSGSAKLLLRHCAPELTGLAVVGFLSVVIRVRGDRTGVEQEFDDVWSSIKSEWPVLITADTLLSLQAMLRLIIAVSVVLRTGDPSARPVPLSKEPAAFLCLAACVRAGVVARTPNYMLDGPFGGTLPVACEVAVVPLLALLATGVSKKTLLSSGVAVGAAVWFSSRNSLNLGEDTRADTMFILAHTLELTTSFMYFARTLSIVCDCVQSSASAAQAGFIHLLMVLQQSMAAYYFVVAFEYTPDLVAVGKPFEILQYGNIAALGAFLGALALHAASVDESVVVAPAQAHVVRPVAAAL